VLGGFSAPSLVTRALAPFGFALALDSIGAAGAITALIAVSLVSCAAYVAATQRDSEPAAATSEA
jgi:hypothetical protein